MTDPQDPLSQWETNTPLPESAGGAGKKDWNSTINKLGLIEDFPPNQENILFWKKKHSRNLIPFYSWRVRLTILF